MSNNSNFLGVLTLDPNINAFGNSAFPEYYRSPHISRINSEHEEVQREFFLRETFLPTPVNSASRPANNAAQVPRPAIGDSLQANTNMHLWPQRRATHFQLPLSRQDDAQFSGLEMVKSMTQDPTQAVNPLQSKPTLDSHGSIPSAVSLEQSSSIHWDFARMAKKLEYQNLQLTDQLISANQHMRSLYDTNIDLKCRLAEQEKENSSYGRQSSAGDSRQSYTTSPNFNRPWKSFATHPYEPASLIPSPIKLESPTQAPRSPITPKKQDSPPGQQQHRNRNGRRHHRTATPEQRTIRAMMNNKPVFTLGMDPQSDRCLLYDFFEHIKQWAAAYTVQMKSLNAEQVHNLYTHAVLAEGLGQPSQLKMLVTEQDMLIAIVTGILSRHMWKYSLDEHALNASEHPQAHICEDLANRWTMLDLTAHEEKHNLLVSQQQIYTSIKNASDHKAWRTSCAERFTNMLLSDLAGLLTTDLSTPDLLERNHTLSELYVKGYRIGFRLRMAAIKWQFQWPLPGTEFNPATMVNESRMLYGNILRTMNSVMNEPRAHEVRFSISPTVTKSDFSGGSEHRVVVHNALCHITRQGYA